MKNAGSYAIIFFMMICACSNSEIKKTDMIKPPLKIAFSRCAGTPNYGLYVKWIHHFDSTVKCINLFGCTTDSALNILKECDGLILSGGPDVDPGRYGQASDTGRCKMNEKRDTLEFALIKKAAEMDMPMLGICRGQQILNVAYGGSLIVDISEDHGKKIIHKCKGDTCLHEISVDTTSVLYYITKQKKGTVNSFHHQAVNKLASVFRITAYADDSIPEAMEWKDPLGKPFMLCVQWHPERLDLKNPFSFALAKAFLKKVSDSKDAKLQQVKNCPQLAACPVNKVSGGVQGVEILSPAGGGVGGGNPKSKRMTNDQ
jgi:putative glutamine amidotransferase